MDQHLKIKRMAMGFFLVLAIISTGIMTGIFFTWTNAVTPGIGRLNDLHYLTALKSMNRSILNPLFFVVFFLPVIAIPLIGWFTYQRAGSIEWGCIVLSGLLYTTGCFFITILGNVPLNEMLEKSSIDTLDAEQLKQLRTAIETKWNMYNLARTLSSLGAFLFAVLYLYLKK